MTALLLTEIFPPQVGGSGRWFWEVYRRAERNRFVIVAGEHREQSAFDATHDLPVVRLPLAMSEWGIRSRAGLMGYWRTYRAVARLSRNKRVDMIHCGRCLPEGVVALARYWMRRVPYVCFVHGEDIGGALNSREHAFLVRLVLRNARRCLANSYNTARMLREEWHLSSDRVSVVHPGVDTSYFHPAPRDSIVRERLGWRDRTVILTVGRLQRRKGQDMLIRALPSIRDEVPNVLYAIDGSGEERRSLAELVEDLDVKPQVQFVDDASDRVLLDCYQQCDLFALPNREVNGDIEGFGMVLIEAQACGKPVIAGRSGGTAETLIPGVTGELVHCGEPALIADALLSLLRDSARLEAMGAAARRWVVEHFDWSVAAIRARQALWNDAEAADSPGIGLAALSKSDIQ